MAFDDWPESGRMVLLVYRECERGCWCATGEGARHPLCDEHGLPMVPPLSSSDAVLVGGGGTMHRMGFFAVFGPERDMVKMMQQAPTRKRVYAPVAIAAATAHAAEQARLEVE